VAVALHKCKSGATGGMGESTVEAGMSVALFRSDRLQNEPQEAQVLCANDGAHANPTHASGD